MAVNRGIWGRMYVQLQRLIWRGLRHFMADSWQSFMRQLPELAPRKNEWMDWERLFQRFGEKVRVQPRAIFDSYAAALEAARLGQGVLLGWGLSFSGLFSPTAIYNLSGDGIWMPLEGSGYTT